MKPDKPKQFAMTEKRYFFTLVFLSFAALLSSEASAQSDSFHTLKLDYGISLEVPSHWIKLPIDSRKNLRAAGESLVENSGVEADSGKKEPLLAINSVPSPHGAMIRLSVTTPASYSQSDLAIATESELKDVQLEMLSMFRQIQASGGPEIIEMQRVSVERFNGHLALVLPYIRAGINGPPPWQVKQYKIPVSGRLIEFTLSHRQSDEIVWKPILEKVKRSIKF